MKSQKPSHLFSVVKSGLMGLLVFATVSAGAAENTLSKSIQAKDSSPHFGVNLEPIYLLTSGIGGKAEYFLTDRVSVGIGGTYIPSHQVEKSNNDDTSTTVGGNYKWEHNEILLGSNIMLTGTLGTNGAYLNPAVGYQHTAISNFSEFNLGGSLNSPMARLTAGYQWITASNFRFAAGGGLSLVQSADVVVADSSGNEVYRQKSSSLGGLALDLHVGYVF